MSGTAKTLRSGLASVIAALLAAACAAPAPVAATTSPAEGTPRLPEERSPAPNLLTGGQPTPAQLQAAKAAGYATVINLRAPGEPGSWDEADTVTTLGMRYVAIPVAGADGLTRANAQLLADAIAQSRGPVVVHCASGNRVGALLAIKAALLDGVDPEAAFALGKAAGMTSLESSVRQLLGLP
jgi:uncharacterized protein (TIGR01244 family)